MFGSLRRENARLRSLAETRRQQAVTATDLRETAIGNQARIAKRFSAQHDELTRLRAERGDADRLRLAWKSAQQRAAQARTEADASRRATRHLAGSYTDLMDTGEPMRMFIGPSLAQQLTIRLSRALRACARYRGEIATKDRLILDQQKTLDCLLGLDSAAVEAGADWQDRRTDRPGGVR